MFNKTKGGKKGKILNPIDLPRLYVVSFRLKANLHVIFT